MITKQTSRKPHQCPNRAFVAKMERPILKFVWTLKGPLSHTVLKNKVGGSLFPISELTPIIRTA